MKLWKRETTLEHLNQTGEGCMVGHVGIQFTHMEDYYLKAVMPADNRTTQLFGLLHGGASMVLAEFMGSMAGYLCTEGEQKVVWLQINANIRAVFKGQVRGVCRALHVGRRNQVWQIEIFDDRDRLCCVPRVTPDHGSTAVLE